VPLAVRTARSDRGERVTPVPRRTCSNTVVPGPKAVEAIIGTIARPPLVTTHRSPELRQRLADGRACGLTDALKCASATPGIPSLTLAPRGSGWHAPAANFPAADRERLVLLPLAHKASD
jgi:hypothetical protein